MIAPIITGASLATFNILATAHINLVVGGELGENFRPLLISGGALTTGLVVVTVMPSKNPARYRGLAHQCDEMSSAEEPLPEITLSHSDTAEDHTTEASPAR